MRIKIAPLLLIPLLASCGGNGESSSSAFPEHDYSEIEKLTITYDQSFSINEKDHYVYFYQDTCHSCSELKNEVIEFALHGYIDFYFIFATTEIPHNYTYQEINQTLGSNNIEDVLVGITPQLVLIKNGKIEKNIIKNIFIQEELSHYYQ